MRRRTGGRLGLRIFALLATAILFSGCVTMAVESEFNEDGSGTHSIAITMDTAILTQLGEMGDIGDPFEDFSEIEEDASDLGYRVERIEENDVIGVRISTDIDDSSNLGDVLNSLFNASATESESVSPFGGTFEKDGDTYRINLTVDGNALSQGAGEGLAEDSDELEMFGGLESIFEFTYRVTLPGDIDASRTNGRINGDGSVTWNLPLQGTQALSAVSQGEGGSSLALILVIIGIVVFGLIGLAAVAFFLLMNRRGTDLAPSGGIAGSAPPPGDGSGPDQPTQPVAQMPSTPSPPTEENREQST